MIERCRSVERVRRSLATSFFLCFITEFGVRIVRRIGAVPCMYRPGPGNYVTKKVYFLGRMNIKGNLGERFWNYKLEHHRTCKCKYKTTNNYSVKLQVVYIVGR